MDAIAPKVDSLTSREGSDPRVQLRAQAEALESFLFAEMLRVSGTGSPSPAGGSESKFDSFLRQAQADAVAVSGQTGLAESIYRSMLSRSGLNGS